MKEADGERLTSGKAVAAALLLAGVLLAAAAVFLFVVFERSCGRPGKASGAVSGVLRAKTPSL